MWNGTKNSLKVFTKSTPQQPPIEHRQNNHRPSNTVKLQLIDSKHSISKRFAGLNTLSFLPSISGNVIHRKLAPNPTSTSTANTIFHQLLPYPLQFIFPIDPAYFFSHLSRRSCFRNIESDASIKTRLYRLGGTIHKNHQVGGTRTSPVLFHPSAPGSPKDLGILRRRQEASINCLKASWDNQKSHHTSTTHRLG